MLARRVAVKLAMVPLYSCQGFKASIPVIMMSAFNDCRRAPSDCQQAALTVAATSSRHDNVKKQGARAQLNTVNSFSMSQHHDAA